VGTALKEKGKISTDLYTIKLGHKGKVNKGGKEEKAKFKKSDDIPIGVPISIKFEKEKDPIFQYQEEWLASYDILLEKMADKGFTPIKDLYLDTNAILPDSNKEFAKLNRSVVFKRGKVGGKRVARRRVAYKQEDDEDFVSELAPGKSKNIRLPVNVLDGEFYLKDGFYTRFGVEWDESSFLRSYMFLTDEDYKTDDKETRDQKVSDLRERLGDKLTKKVFGKLKAGNVQKRMAFDKLYTRVDDKIIGDEKVAVEAGYIEYSGRVANGPVGHEISMLLNMLDNVKITVVDQTGKLLDKGKKGKSAIDIMKIGDYAYSPLVMPDDIGFKSAKTE